MDIVSFDADGFTVDYGPLPKRKAFHLPPETAGHPGTGLVEVDISEPAVDHLPPEAKVKWGIVDNNRFRFIPFRPGKERGFHIKMFVFIPRDSPHKFVRRAVRTSSTVS